MSEVASGATAGERDQTSAVGTVRVHVANGPLIGPVLRRMVSIVLARADWPVTGLDDALLVCDALSAHVPGYARGARVALFIEANAREAELRIEDLNRDGAANLVQDAALPVVGNVLEGIAERVSVEPEANEGSRLVLVLNASQPAPSSLPTPS